MHNGIAFDLAMRLDDIERAAYCIVFSGFKGRKYDWDRMDFEPET